MNYSFCFKITIVAFKTTSFIKSVPPSTLSITERLCIMFQTDSDSEDVPNNPDLQAGQALGRAQGARQDK